MIIRFACLFLGVLGLFAFYDIGFKEWFSWSALVVSILFISHAINPKWSDKILLATCGIESIDQACVNGNAKRIKAYLKAKADPNFTNKNKLTLLDIATENNHSEIADLLRKYGGKTADELKAEGK